MIKYTLAMIIIGIMVLGAVIYGFTSTGSPFYVRMQKFDAKRVADITAISYEIQNYYEKTKALPDTLSDVKESASYSSYEVTDPETKKPYVYEAGIGGSYRICAIFSTSTIEESERMNLPTTYGYTNEKYLHPKGKHCFSFFGSRLFENSTSTTSGRVADKNIKSVTTDANQINYSNFPVGLFSSDIKESGLINYESKPITVLVEFRTPQKISSVSTIFTNCESKDCYKWSISGIKKDGSSVILAKDIYTSEEVTSEVNIDDESEFLKIMLTAERLESFNGLYYVHLKKLTFSYAN